MTDEEIVIIWFSKLWYSKPRYFWLTGSKLEFFWDKYGFEDMVNHITLVKEND